MMVWRGNLSDISAAVGKAVAAEMASVQVTIAQLKEANTANAARMETMISNYATRADVAQLRTEMHQMAAQFMPKVLSDQRYDELQRSNKARDEDVDRRIKDLEEAVRQSSNRGFSTGQNAVFWVLGGIGALLTLSTVIISLIALFRS